MNNFLQNSVFFGVFISIITYEIGVLIKKKLKIAIFNPLLISMALIIIFLLIFHVDYDTYESGAKYLSYFLTPATVALAVPLYEQIEPLKKNWKAILAGIFAGAATKSHGRYLPHLVFVLSVSPPTIGSLMASQNRENSISADTAAILIPNTSV